MSSSSSLAVSKSSNWKVDKQDASKIAVSFLLGAAFASSILIVRNRYTQPSKPTESETSERDRDPKSESFLIALKKPVIDDDTHMHSIHKARKEFLQHRRTADVDTDSAGEAVSGGERSERFIKMVHRPRHESVESFGDPSGDADDDIPLQRPHRLQSPTPGSEAGYDTNASTAWRSHSSFDRDIIESDHSSDYTGSQRVLKWMSSAKNLHHQRHASVQQYLTKRKASVLDMEAEGVGQDETIKKLMGNKIMAPTQAIMKQTDMSTADLKYILKGNNIWTVLFTGGPCAGKTTALSTVQEFLQNRGFLVYLVPEASTVLRNGGLKWQAEVMTPYQRIIAKMQTELEDMYLYFSKNASETYSKPVAILIDRGLFDGMAYVDNDVWEDTMRFSGHEMDSGDALTDLWNRYDLVIHLVTAADGAEEFYQLTSYRFEGIEAARALDMKLRTVYDGHPDRRVVHNTGGFDTKIHNVIEHICDKISIPNTARRPKRFIINVKSDPNLNVSDPITAIIATIESQVSAEYDLVISRFRKQYLMEHEDDQKAEESNPHAKPLYTFVFKSEMLTRNKEGVQHMKEIYLGGATPVADRTTTPRLETTPVPPNIDPEQTREARRQLSSITTGDFMNDFAVQSKSYMLIAVSEDHGQKISVARKLNSHQFRDYSNLWSDEKRVPIDQLRMHFYFHRHFCEFEMFLSPDKASNLMILKVFRHVTSAAANKADILNTEIELPPCIEVLQDVTRNPEFTSHHIAMKSSEIPDYLE